MASTAPAPAAVAERPEAGTERAGAEAAPVRRPEAAERLAVLGAGAALAPVPVFSAPATAGPAGLRRIKGNS
ncbi:hypothetical protein GXW82_19950 [Streptacidiphilus sp. 4-A2]|nr:hypothetical protein [Streptacidiphilus sp. 4-A2]